MPQIYSNFDMKIKKRTYRLCLIKGKTITRPKLKGLRQVIYGLPQPFLFVQI